LDVARTSWPGIVTILPFPAAAILASAGVISLLPTIFFRQRH
jgi:hypothetical protein